MKIKTFKTNQILLGIGHSARDTFKMLNNNNIYMESKPFAVGLRIIHDQKLIDNSMIHGKDILSPASYKTTHITKDGRGVYSFCMCPGGYVINSSSETHEQYKRLGYDDYAGYTLAPVINASIDSVNPDIKRLKYYMDIY